MCKFRLKYTYCQWKAVIAAAVKQLWRAQRQCTLPWKGMCKFWLKYTYCQWKAVIAATVKQLWRAQRQCTLPCVWFLYEEKVASPFLTWSRSMIVGVLHWRNWWRWTLQGIFWSPQKALPLFRWLCGKLKVQGNYWTFFKDCKELGIKLSVTKLNVMPSRKDVWELFGGEEEIGALDKSPLPPIQQ